jgi:hypothetical protein
VFARPTAFLFNFFMASKLDIANFALAEVAQIRITDLLEDNEPARLCNLHIDQAIREVLREGMWKSARSSAELAEIGTAPDFGWLKSFQLPNDYVRMVSFNDVDPDNVREELFELRGDQLFTDETSASIVYVRDLTIVDGDINAMGPLLTKACVLNLAVKLSWPLQQSRVLQEVLLSRYEQAIRKTKSADSREEFRPLVNRASSSAWVSSRYTSTNG